jgi:glycosyltransferase involved in cell wall biosynthesis
MTDGYSSSGPDVSIVLPVHNEIDHLDIELKRIRSAFEQSSYSYEIIVVDDASTDGGSELLAGIPWIRLISFRTNRGPGAARKIGTEAGTPDCVCDASANNGRP